MSDDRGEQGGVAFTRIPEPVEVLVVDDDPSIREVLVELLNLGGCLALEARSGRTALDLLRSRRHRPAVILLDLLMPDMDGWQFRAEQLADPVLSAIPVIVMSARRVGPDISAQARLSKPFSGEELLGIVARLARKQVQRGGEPGPRHGARLLLPEQEARGGDRPRKERAP